LEERRAKGDEPLELDGGENVGERVMEGGWSTRISESKLVQVLGRRECGESRVRARVVVFVRKRLLRLVGWSGGFGGVFRLAAFGREEMFGSGSADLKIWDRWERGSHIKAGQIRNGVVDCHRSVGSGILAAWERSMSRHRPGANKTQHMCY
jgi:hypothetical protein